MNIKGHKVGCCVLVGISIYSKNYELIPGVVLGSFLPDLDCRFGSYIRSKLKLLGRLYNVLPQCRLFGYVGYKHRSLLLHSVWTILSIGILSYIFDSKLILGVLFGVLGHHILDNIRLKNYIYGG